MAFLTWQEFRSRTSMPTADVDIVMAQDPTFLPEKLEDVTDEINTMMRKRYSVPFSLPYPRILQRWLCAIVTPEVYEKRGWNPSDQQSQIILQRAEDARKQMKEAADSETGLYELPLRADTGASGVTRGGPFGYSEASPYVCMDVQRNAADDEDRNGCGT